MTKLINPHMSLPLTNPMVGAKHIEIHDTFLIEYTGRSFQDPGNSNSIRFYDEELQQKVIENRK